MKKNLLLINFAVLNIQNNVLFDHFARYLLKYNINKILIIKYKRTVIDYKILKKYHIVYKVVNAVHKNDIYSNLTYYKKNLPHFFFNIDTNHFLNENLFNLKNIFKKNKNKFIYFEKNSIIPKLNIFDKTKISFYKKINQNYTDKNCLKINYTKNDFFEIDSENNPDKISKFFNKIYNKTIILDRDGVINKNLGYVGNIKKFEWIKGAQKAIKYLNKKRYNLFVATNQSGVARGFYSEKKVIKIHQFIKKELQLNDCYINNFYYCPYHKDATVIKYKKDSVLRKPKNGMFLLIKKEWNVDAENVYMIGDQESDMEFAKNSKITGILFGEKNLLSFVKKHF
jgi:D-glycero-D-manno-heptose 1,7-bisphosphate phosphatase